MREVYKAYIAGFIDGEGCFSIDKQYPHGAQFRLVSTDKPTLDYIRELCDYGTVRTTTKSWNSTKWKRPYLWHINNHDMLKLIDDIFPYLKTKKEQSKVMLKWLKTLRAHGGHKNNPLTAKEVIIRKRAYKDMSRLNKRGPK